MKKNGEHLGRIIEDVSARDSQTERIDEFWSVESLRKRSIDEQYPKSENETDDHYNNRIQEIQTLTELAQADLSEEDKREIKNGAYSEKSGKAAVPNYRKFGVNSLRMFDMAEKNPDLLHSDENKYGLERQQAQKDKAEYYIKLYQKNQPELSEFSDLVPDDKLTRDQDNLQEKERKIEARNKRKSPEERAKDEQMETWDRVAEAALYPLALNFGLFDNNMSGQRRARAIYPSKFDDLFHGVDMAFMIPIGVNEQGKTKYAPVTFDCATSANPLGIMKKFSKIKNNGRTRINYAKSEDDELITNVHPLNFVLGVEHTALIGDHGLMRGDGITHAPQTFVHDIYAQIHAQARLRAEYYLALRCERGESKDTKLVDVLWSDELADMRQTVAVRDFFAQKCEETAIDKKRPFDLSRAYDRRSPVFLAYQEATELLHAQRKHIDNIKKQKGWK